MSNLFNRLTSGQLALGASGQAQSKTGFALGSAYTYNSAGAAYGFRWVAPVSGNLTDVWFFVTATAGTPGVVTCELRNFNTVTTGKPGASLLASQTITPGTTANKWINVHFASPYSVVIGTPYWLVFGDAGWTTGNTTTIDDISIWGRNYPLAVIAQGWTTTDGYATVQTNVPNTPAMVLKFADGTLFGNPFTTAAGYTSNTRERGMKILGLTEDLYISGVSLGGPSSNISGLKIYQGTTAPGGTTVLTVSFPTGAGAHGASYFAPFKLLKNTLYRVVLTYGSSSNNPTYWQIEDFATTTDVTNAALGQGTIFETIDNGSGGWTDNIDRLPQMALIFSDQSVQPGALVNGGVLAEG
jgi:hypothetical protein